MKEKIIIRKLPPVWFINALNAFRHGLLWLNRRLFPSNVVLYEYFQYFWLLPCIKVAAELDIAGILKERPMSVQELAVKTGSNSDYLFRLMRALASQGIFREMGSGLFRNTRMSLPLADGRDSIRYMILHHLGDINWSVFNHLSFSVKNGKDAFSMVYGKSIYEYLAENRNENDLFDLSMSNLTEIAIHPILNAYDFSGALTVADIGGGEGLLLSSILYKHPGIKGILFDLPEGFHNTRKVLQKYGVDNRITIQTGDFFETIPAGADIYLLKNVLHNWGNEECTRILSNIRSSLPAGGKLLILEMVINEDNFPSFGKLVDIQMMVFMKAGKERTRKEFIELLNRSGLRMNRLIPTISPLCIIEAVYV